MSELSAATTAVSILDIAARAVSYIQAVKGAGTDGQKLLVELTRARGLLATLTDVTEVAESGDWSRALQNANMPDGPLHTFKVLLEEIITGMAVVRAPKSASKMAQSAAVSGRNFLGFLSHRQSKSSSGSSSLIAQAKGPGNASKHATRYDPDVHRKVGIKVNNATQDLKWPFSQARQQELLAKLERIKTHFLVALTSDSIRLSKLIHEQVQATHVKVDVITDNTKTMREHLEGSKEWTPEQQHIFQSVSSLDTAPDIPGNRPRELKTCSSWLLANDTFCQWHTNGGTMLLNGTAGFGNTSICHVVEKYIQSSGGSDVFVVAIYFRYSSQSGNHNSVQSVLSYIVEEMLRVCPQFQKYYNKLMLTGRGPLEATDALRIIHRARQDFQYFYIMLDVLDECEAEQVKELIETLTSLRSPPRLFATSRPGSLSKHFSNTLNLSCEEIAADLEVYVRESLINKAFGKVASGILQDPVEFERAVEPITSLSEGRFVYATLLIDRLSKARSRDEYDKLVARLVSLKQSAEQDKVNTELGLLEELLYHAAPLTSPDEAT